MEGRRDGGGRGRSGGVGGGYTARDMVWGAEGGHGGECGQGRDYMFR